MLIDDEWLGVNLQDYHQDAGLHSAIHPCNREAVIGQQVITKADANRAAGMVLNSVPPPLVVVSVGREGAVEEPPQDPRMDVNQPTPPPASGPGTEVNVMELRRKPPILVSAFYREVPHRMLKHSDVDANYRTSIRGLALHAAVLFSHSGRRARSSATPTST
ncbi:unnamed protein product [Tuber aestivum]|uniref:Uncharacterized protein n=1 Tax=Tuber aestivum TaxID=59557 RepID=A0A292PR52_9PEZI|nr:unnamed protein product [Tuber aestivum]